VVLILILVVIGLVLLASRLRSRLRSRTQAAPADSYTDNSYSILPATEADPPTCVIAASAGSHNSSGGRLRLRTQPDDAGVLEVLELTNATRSQITLRARRDDTTQPEVVEVP
jgi:hypothetical protein